MRKIGLLLSSAEKLLEKGEGCDKLLEKAAMYAELSICETKQYCTSDEELVDMLCREKLGILEECIGTAVEQQCMEWRMEPDALLRIPITAIMASPITLSFVLLPERSLPAVQASLAHTIADMRAMAVGTVRLCLRCLMVQQPDLAPHIQEVDAEEIATLILDGLREVAIHPQRCLNGEAEKMIGDAIQQNCHFVCHFPDRLPQSRRQS